jgi:hypothetical protein
MERIFESKFYKIKNDQQLNNNNKISNKDNQYEENKMNMNSRKILNNKFRYKSRCNLLLKPKINKNGTINSLIANYSTVNNSLSLLNRPSIKTKLKPINDISKDILDSTTQKLSVIKKDSNIINNLKRTGKKFEFNKLLPKSKSSSNIFYKMNKLLPLIRPRQILINIYSGPYEYKINDINERSQSFKKFGRNSFYMGERYNPDNFVINEKLGVHRNYYGKIFSN